MNLPTGTVTFLFTDVEGSTRLVKELGARRYGEVLDTHRQLLHGVFQEAGGIEVDRQGDSFFVVFASASAAVRAAASAQLRFGSHDWPADASVRVRIGIHTGEAVVGDDGYRGFSVHRAARICAAAHGGQILMSGTTRDVVEADLPSDLHVRDLGPSQLPGIDRPEPLFQLVVAGLPDAFPSPRAETVLRLVADTVDLLEREVELAALDALIAAVPAGGRVVVVEGPAGIGKTRLLAETRRRAASAGLQVLAARGSELELEFSYGAVRQLFEPLLAAASPEERGELLAGPASLAMPIFDPASLLAEPDSQSSLAMLHGLFWLTANLAERRPTVLAIDDLHWCDRASLGWLTYVLPRLEGLSLLIVVGLRPAEPGADNAQLGRIATDPLAIVLRPGALSEEATGRLMTAALDSDVDAAFRIAFHDASGGNPLLVRELANAVAAEGFALTDANVSRLRELSGHGVARAVSLRLARLPAATRSLARAVAVLGDDADLRLAAALAGLGEATAADAAADLAGIEILRRGTPLAFVHPVVRSAVYSELLRSRPRSWARAGCASPRRGERGARARRGTATPRPTRGRPVGGRGATHRCPIRSGARRPGQRRSRTCGGQRKLLVTRRQTFSTSSAWRKPGSRIPRRSSISSLRVPQRVTLDSEHASLSTSVPRSSPPADCRTTLSRFSRRRSRSSPEAIPSWRSSSKTSSSESHVSSPASTRSRRSGSTAYARGHPSLVVGDRVLLANLASETARAGTGRSEAVDLAERALTGDTLLKEHFDPAFVYAVLTLVCAEHLDDADRLLGEALDDAQERGLVSHFFIVSCYRSLVALHRGSLADAVADAEVALGVIDLHGLEFGRVYAVGLVVPALIEQGDFSRSRQLIHSAMPGEEITSYGQSLFFEARAQLLLASGEHARALRVCTAHGAFLEAFGVWNPAISAWRSQAALALLGLGRRDEAQGYAQRELSLARLWEAPRALGRSLVVAGVAEGGDDGIALLREAVAVLELSQARLEHARALVELGSALRRTNRRSDAREPLRRGLELAAVCGAVPLADRAETELRATGARPRRIALSGVGSLTPSERRVAELAAGGDTNRQIAQALFVTSKTVEVHLSSVYRKLDISSRSQLPKALEASAEQQLAPLSPE